MVRFRSVKSKKGVGIPGGEVFNINMAPGRYKQETDRQVRAGQWWEYKSMTTLSLLF